MHFYPRSQSSADQWHWGSCEPVTKVCTEINFITHPFTFIKFVFVSLLYLYLDLYYAWAHSMLASTNGRAGLWRACINVKKTDTYRPSEKKTQRSNGKIQSNFLISHIFRLMLFFHILQESNLRIRGGLHSVYITILEKVQGGMLTLLTSFLTWYVIVKSRRQWA